MIAAATQTPAADHRTEDAERLMNFADEQLVVAAAKLAEAASDPPNGRLREADPRGIRTAFADAASAPVGMREANQRNRSYREEGRFVCGRDPTIGRAVPQARSSTTT